MNKALVRAYIVEMLGTFAVVLFAAGVVCVNQLAAPEQQNPGQVALFNNQPGLVGIALAQGLALAVALVVTMHVSGGYLNPAVTIMLWVFNRMPSVRAAWLIGAQLLGAVLAGAVVRFTFSDEKVLTPARMGAPHLNALVYGESIEWPSLFSGACIEFILTFFLVFAIFGAIRSKAHWQRMDDSTGTAGAEDDSYHSIDTRLAALLAGLSLCACVLFAYPLTGAATNPARWFGPVFWEFAVLRPAAPAQSPFADMFVYIAGPIAGALAAGLVFFRLMPVPHADKMVAHIETKKRSVELHVTKR